MEQYSFVTFEIYIVVIVMIQQWHCNNAVKTVTNL